MKRCHAALIVSSLAVPMPSVAGDCEQAYAAAVVSRNHSAVMLAERNYVFSLFCKEDGHVQDSSRGADFNAVVGKMSFGLDATSSDSSKSMETFCKQHSAFRTSKLFVDTDSSVGITANLLALNQCIALEKNGVNVSLAETKPTAVTAYFGFNPGTTKLELNGAQYDAARATCIAVGLSDQPIPITSTFKTTVASKPFSVLCSRIASKTKTGIMKYEHFAVTIATNQGNYQIESETEGLLGYDLALENKARYDQSIAERERLRKESESLKQALQAPKPEWHWAYTSEGVNYGSPGERFGCGANLDNEAKRICGNRPYVGPYNVVSYYGGRCGVNGFVYACISH